MMKKYKDTFAAKNSQLYQALEDEKFVLAETLYQEAEAVFRKHCPNWGKQSKQEKPE
jgi:hypothetical protein